MSNSAFDPLMNSATFDNIRSMCKLKNIYKIKKNKYLVYDPTNL